MKKNNKQLWIIVAILALLLFSLIYYSIKNDVISINLSNFSNTKKRNEISVAELEFKEKKFEYVEKASFIIGPNKELVKVKDKPNDKYIIEWYQDPVCPACVRLESLMKEHIDKVLESGLYVRYYPLAFMNAKTEDEYSLRASSYILATAENSPSIAYEFMTKVFSEEFFPKDRKITTDEQFKKLFIQSGGTEEQWKIITEEINTFGKQIMMKTAQVSNDSEILDKSPTGKLTIPIVIVGNSEKYIDFSGCDDAAECFLDNVREYNKKITTKKEPISIEGMLDSYEPGDVMKIKVKTESKYSKIRWSIKHQNSSEDILHEEGPELEYTISIKDKDSYIVVQSLDKENKVIETLESKITVK